MREIVKHEYKPGRAYCKACWKEITHNYIHDGLCWECSFQESEKKHTLECIEEVYNKLEPKLAFAIVEKLVLIELVRFSYFSKRYYGEALEEFSKIREKDTNIINNIKELSKERHFRTLPVRIAQTLFFIFEVVNPRQDIDELKRITFIIRNYGKVYEFRDITLHAELDLTIAHYTFKLLGLDYEYVINKDTGFVVDIEELEAPILINQNDFNWILIQAI